MRHEQSRRQPAEAHRSGQSVAPVPLALAAGPGIGRRGEVVAQLRHLPAPTEPGNSGSPVFDRRWKLIALHHAGSDEMRMLHGGGTYQANEGIWIGRIKEAIQEDLKAGA